VLRVATLSDELNDWNEFGDAGELAEKALAIFRCDIPIELSPVEDFGQFDIGTR
jgi:hypothetical protein